MISANTKRLATALVALSIAGCGLKGPLYLPDQKQGTVAPESAAKTPSKRPTTPSPAPQSQKKDAADSEKAPPASPPDPDRPSNPEPVTPPDR